MNVYIECGGSLTLKDRDTVIIEKKRLGFYQACFKGNERHRVIWSSWEQNLSTLRLNGLD